MLRLGLGFAGGRCRCFQSLAFGSLDFSKHLIRHFHGKTTEIRDKMSTFGMTCDPAFYTTKHVNLQRFSFLFGVLPEHFLALREPRGSM
jgi:hypothetical protein